MKIRVYMDCGAGEQSCDIAVEDLGITEEEFEQASDSEINQLVQQYWEDQGAPEYWYEVL